MKVVIIKYNAGNIMSVDFALQRLGIEPVLSDNPEEIVSADKVIFPGVGEASTTMKFLQEKKLDQVITGLKQPVLGICLGLQLMCSHSEEGDTPCLGIFKEKVKKFPPKLKVPHMGWNSIHDLESSLFSRDLEGKHVYFVHSFYAEKKENTIATTDYILHFSAALQKNNFYASQFHPEKSGRVGSRILENFLKI